MSHPVSERPPDQPPGHPARFPARRSAETGQRSPARTTSRGHGHLWSLPDGTGLHAPHGELVVEAATGRVCCHLCGQWFVSLGSHVRSHGYSAESYRTAMGLCRTRRLIAADLSRSIAARQAKAYRDSPELRARLAAGQELSRSGRLAVLGRAGQAASGSAERTRIRRETLRVGREQRATRRAEDLLRRLHDLGAESLRDYLRREYTAGTSLRRLAATTGLGWARLRRELVAAGVPVRTAGATSGRQQRERARAAEAEAARRVGTDDLAGWLRARRDAGWSFARLAAAVGHSPHWVRSRLTDGDSRAASHPAEMRSLG